MAEIEIISRPKAPGSDVEIVSRPKGAEPDTFTGRVAANWSAGRADSQAGMDALLGRPSSPWERAKGAGQAMWGGAQMAGAVPDAAARTAFGDPAEVTARAAGAPPWAVKTAGDAASVVGGIAAGGATKQIPGMVRAIPQTAEDIMALLRQGASKAMPTINTAATKVGGVARSTVNAADDLVKQRAAGAERSAAEKAANAAPSKESIKTAGGGEFQAAKELGGDIKPEVTQGRISSLRQHVIDSDVDLHAEDTYPITRKMLDYLERRQEDVSSFKDMMSLQHEAQNYVKRAKKAGETTGDNSDYRAATIAMKNLDEFVVGLKPEDMVGGDPAAANEALRKAKELWGRQSKMAIVEDIAKKTERWNDPDYLQAKFRGIAEDDYAFERFTPAEQKIIDEIAGESRLEKAAAALPYVMGKPRKLIEAARGTNTARMAKTKELLDMIARGEAAQTEAAATKAAKPGIGQKINEIFLDRPGRGLGPAQ